MMMLHKWSAWDQTSSLLSKDNDGWQINAPHKKKSYNYDFSCFDNLCNRLIRTSSSSLDTQRFKNLRIFVLQNL